MNITICGSVDFTHKIIEVKKELESMGHSVNIPYFTTKIMNGEMTFDEYIKNKESENGDISLREKQPIDMVQRYWDFIKNSDCILVLNLEKKGIQNYIGGSTLMEIGFAYGFQKKIYLYNPIPERSERIHYTDEIIDMDPIIINRNLNLINS